MAADEIKSRMLLPRATADRVNYAFLDYERKQTNWMLSQLGIFSTPGH